MTDYFGKNAPGVGTRLLRGIPQEVTGYSLDESSASFWSIIIPEERTNLITNPSFEVDTTSWTITAGSSSASKERASRGFKSLKVTETSPTNFIARINFTATAAAHTASVDLAGPVGATFKIAITTLSVEKEFTILDHGWNRYEFTFLATAGTLQLSIESTDTAVTGRVFYLDGVQVEAGAYATTYLDGDIPGFSLDLGLKEYWWDAAPNASTSGRSGLTRHGGREVFLDQADLLTVGIVGMSFPSYEADLPQLANGGTIFSSPVESAREMTLVARFVECSYQELAKAKRTLFDLIKVSSRDQPIILRYRPTTANGRRYGRTLEIQVVYTGGLEGNITNFFQESVSISMIALTPFYSVHGDTKGDLTAAVTMNPSPGIFKRGRLGGWEALGSGATNGDIDGVVVYEDKILAYGDFTTLAGQAIRRVGIWDGSSWSECDSGLNGHVRDGVVGNGPYEGSIIFSGAFTADGAGAGNLRRIVEYDVAADTFTEIGGGLTPDTVYSVACWPNGDIYWGGGSTADGGATTAFRGCGYWDYSASAWNNMTTGLDATAFDVSIGPEGKIYLSGSFTEDLPSTLTLQGAARWNPFLSSPNWEEIGGVSAGGIYNHYWDRRGQAFYLFELSRGRIYRWNGTGFNQIAPPDLGATGAGEFTGEMSDGIMYVGDTSSFYGFARVGKSTDTMHRFLPSGSQYLPSDIEAETSNWAGARLFSELDDGSVILGFDYVPATIYAAETTTVTNLGETMCGPVVKITGPGFIREIKNYTTGHCLYLSIDVAENEIIYIDMSKKGQPILYSNMRTQSGILSGIILPGSNLGNFSLAPGDNEISIFMTDTDGNSAVDFRWNDSYPGIEYSA